MVKKQFFWIMLLAIFGLIASQSHLAAQGQSAQRAAKPTKNITGEIAIIRDNYIIRSTIPPLEIYTIINADPQILAPYLDNGTTVKALVRFISGDNVEIISLGGKGYTKKSQ